MVNIASKIQKKMHDNVLRKILNTFPDNELDGRIEVIKQEQQRRKDEKKE